MIDGSGAPYRFNFKSGLAGDPSKNNSIVYFDNIECTINPETIEPPFSENFDTTAIGQIPANWFIFDSDSNTEVKVVDGTSDGVAPVPSNPNCLRFDDNSSTKTANIYKNIENETYGQFEAKVYIPTGSFGFMRIASDTSDMVLIGFSEGNITYKSEIDGLLYPTTITFTHDAWLKIKLLWDKSTGKYYFNK